MNVFVYGTLKQGFGNHHYLSSAVHRGIYCTPPEYDLIPISNSGSFPCMVKGDYRVLGEVYKIEEGTLKRLDQLEGHPNFYYRQMIKLLNGPLCWAYIFPSHPIDWKTSKPVDTTTGIMTYQGLKEWIQR
jgi:gamma-glutamylcyclotransferase (GGCT)/AIG2-like uncharacterized protein YtfP